MLCFGGPYRHIVKLVGGLFCFLGGPGHNHRDKNSAVATIGIIYHYDLGSFIFESRHVPISDGKVDII